jgi:hypothetical protein
MKSNPNLRGPTRLSGASPDCQGERQADEGSHGEAEASGYEHRFEASDEGLVDAGICAAARGFGGRSLEPVEQT